MGGDFTYLCEICNRLVSGMDALIGHKILVHSAVPLTLKMPSQEFGTQTDVEDFDLATFEYVFFFLTYTMLAIQCKLDV